MNAASCRDPHGSQVLGPPQHQVSGPEKADHCARLGECVSPRGSGVESGRVYGKPMSYHPYIITAESLSLSY